MKLLLKVDIATGRLLVDNLEDCYNRQAMGEGRSPPVWHDNPALHQTKEQTGQWEQILFRRICAFNKKRRKNSTPWDEHSLYHLALLTGKEENPFPRVAARLGRSVTSCRSMYYVMQKAGVV
jgi:hypothetical protein